MTVNALIEVVVATHDVVSDPKMETNPLKA